MAVKFSNNAKTKLVAAINSTDTVVRITAGTGELFPILDKEGDWFPLAITNESAQLEIVRATSRTGDAITVQRAQEGTQARAYSFGDAVYLPATAGALAELTTDKVEFAKVAISAGVVTS
ncbi:hypothetical protein [Agrobacterium tumefaciens]|uniref:hypothetical protein n=1 Tax=Agrobacterium tumefaciens TaxID=358 RepID=UPI0015720F45|nr:hypothetical protein [Agrobacterium tumefaciens]